MRSTITIIMVCALVLVLPALVFGQTGGIRGTVVDPSGAVIPDANVSATHTATELTIRTVSSSSGYYYIANLSAGTYRVEVEKAGFNRLLQDNVVVPTAQVVSLDLALELGQTTQTVEVTATAVVLEKETTTVATTVNPKAYLALPLNVGGGARSVEGFINLATGSHGNGSFEAKANGGQIFSRRIVLDGLDIGNVLSQPGDSGKVNTFPPDALQEFTYNTLTPPADQGNNLSGSILYTVKSGTNKLHGSIYEFNTNNALVARSFFQGNKSRFVRNEYGGTVGGPIYIPGVYDGRNRSFWFFNYNRLSRRSAPQSAFITLPTGLNQVGNFSDLPETIYDPATTRADPAGPGFIRDPFPGNIIPTDRLSPAAVLISQGMPDPTIASLSNNFLRPSLSTSGRNNQTMKFDHAITDSQRISWTYNRAGSAGKSCGGLCFTPGDTGEFDSGSQTIAQGMQSAASSPGGSNTHWFHHLNYDLTISPTTLFHFTAGVDRYFQCSPPDSWNFSNHWENLLGIPNMGSGRFPSINYDGRYQDLSGNASFECYYGTVPQLVENIILIRGKHSIKIGAEHSWYSNAHTSPDFPRFEFKALATGLPGTPGTGNPYASQMLGLPNRGIRHIQAHTTHAFYWYQAAYVQDDIKVNRNLTVNLGLRWEVYAPFYDKGDNHSTMDKGTPNPGAGGLPGALIFAGLNGNPRRFDPPIQKKNFSPRIGLAYSPKDNLVVRTGYAVSMIMPARAGSGGVRWSDLGFSADVTRQTTDNGVTAPFQWDAGFPSFIAPPFIDPTFVNGSSAVSYDVNASYPAYIQQWHFTIQQSFAEDWLFDISYVGSKGTRLYSGTMNINQTDSRHLGLGTLLNLPADDPQVAAAGFGPAFPGFTGSLAQSLRPFPQYLYVGAGGNELRLSLLGGAQNGSSSYHSLQAKLQHDFANGLWMLSSFTWQKWLTNATTTAGGGNGQISTRGGFAGVSSRDHFNRSRERIKGPTPGVMLNIAFNYELPFGPGKPFGSGTTGVAAKLLEGWQLNGILTYHSGQPVVAVVTNTLPLFNDINFPNITGGSQIQTQSIQDPRAPGVFYFNAAGFAEPAPFTYGDSSQTLDINGFGNINEDISIMKRTGLGKEGVFLEIRFESFNTFNRHRWTRFQHNVSNPNFGEVGSSSGGRTAQLAGKIIF